MCRQECNGLGPHGSPYPSTLCCEVFQWARSPSVLVLSLSTLELSTAWDVRSLAVQDDQQICAISTIIVWLGSPQFIILCLLEESNLIQILNALRSAFCITSLV